APESAAGRAAISQLFRRHERRIAGWCLRVLGSRPDVADCTQEVLLKLYERLDGFRGDSRFSTWVYTVTRNTCLNWIRDHRELPQHSLDDPGQAPACEDSRIGEIGARLENEEDLAALRSLLDETLTLEEREVVYLHYAHGLTLETISDRLKLTNLSGAKAYIVSAKRKLKSRVEAFLSPPQSGLTS